MTTIEAGSEPYHYNLKVNLYHYNAHFDLVMTNANVPPVLLQLTELEVPDTF